jgi:MFS family permease
MDRAVRARLAVMMALLYAVQGAFWPLMAVHLHDLGVSGRWRGGIFATIALGAMVLPLGAGQLVDRFLAIQRVLALSAALGTGLLATLARTTTAAPAALFTLFLGYWLLTAPMNGLSAALALRNLARPREQYGAVRLWGTIGWMAVGWLVTGVLMWSGSARTGQGAHAAFGVAAALSALLACYCMSLPNTPPLAGKAAHPGASSRRAALELRRRPVVAAFLGTAFGVSLTTPFIYQIVPPYLEARGLPRAWTSTVLTLGQCAEIAALAAFPWMFRRFSYKGTLALGIAAYVLRYGSLALDPPLWVAIAGIPLHGLGVACFNIFGQVFFDVQAPTHLRASAQGLLMVLTSGMGSLLGSLLAGELAIRLRVDDPAVFLVPCLINLGLLTVFWVSFRTGRAEPVRFPREMSG